MWITVGRAVESLAVGKDLKILYVCNKHQEDWASPEELQSSRNQGWMCLMAAKQAFLVAHGEQGPFLGRQWCVGECWHLQSSGRENHLWLAKCPTLV